MLIVLLADLEDDADDAGGSITAVAALPLLAFADVLEEEEVLLVELALREACEGAVFSLVDLAVVFALTFAVPKL